MVYLSLAQRLQQFGLDPQASDRDIRRAYAIQLKQIDPEADPAGFQALYENYQWLLEWSRMPERYVELDDEDYEPEAEDEALADEATELVDEEYAEDTPAEESTPAEAVLLQAMSEAEKVFSAMAEKFSALRSPNATYMLAEAQRILSSALADPALISIDAKGYFEWCVARHLVDGWRPGNEAMFEAALVAFNWADDPRRLTAFQHIGYRINAAINERFAFNQQETSERRKQLEVMRDLRSPKAPTASLLIKEMARATFIAARFPNLLAMVSNDQNLNAWRRLSEKVPRWRRAITFSEGARPNGEKKSNWRWSWAFTGIVIFVNVVIGFVDGPQQPQPRVLPQTIYESASTNTKPIWATAPTEMEIVQRFSGKVDENTCKEAHQLAKQFRPYSTPAIVNFGPAYDRYVSNCAIGKLWPQDLQSVEMVRTARSRLVDLMLVDLKQRQKEAREADSARQAVVQQKFESLNDLRAQQPRYTADDVKRMGSSAPVFDQVIRSGEDSFGLRYKPPISNPVGADGELGER